MYICIRDYSYYCVYVGCVFMYVYMYVCMYVCMYVYMYVLGTIYTSVCI